MSSYLSLQFKYVIFRMSTCVIIVHVHVYNFDHYAMFIISTSPYKGQAQHITPLA